MTDTAQRALKEHYDNLTKRIPGFTKRLEKLGSYRYDFSPSRHTDESTARSFAESFRFSVGPQANYEGEVKVVMDFDDFDFFLKTLEDWKRGSESYTEELWKPNRR